MTQLDPRISLSDSLRAELLLELSGLTRDQQLMIKACAAGSHDFDTYAKIMTEHHGLIHLRGNRLLDSAPHRPGTERDNRKWQPKGAGRYGYQALEPSTTAYLGMSESAETAYVSFEHRTDGHDDSGTWDTWGDDGDGDDENGEGWNAWTDLPGQPAGVTSHGEDLIVSDEETAIALNAMEECDFENFPDATAEAIQLQCAAHVVMGKAGRGTGKQGGKGKGGFPVVRSGLSVEDRKKRLQEIKSRSKCLRCGQTGHWSGDPQCPKGRGAQQPSGKGQHQASKGGKQDSKPSPKPGPKQAFLATAVPNSSSSDDDIDCVYIDSGPSDASPQAYMAYRREGVRIPRAARNAARDALPPGGDRIFGVGQHKGLSFEEVLHRFPGYVIWGRSLKSVGSRDLADFLDWVQNHYVIHEQTMEVERRETPLSEISRASGSDGLPIPIPASSSHKTAKGKPPSPPLPISCAVCTNFSYLGTNAYATVKTCKVCGKVSKEKKVFEKKDPTRCPHINTSRLGSNRATAKTFCKDCGHVIDEMPQEEAQIRRKAAQEIETATSASFDLISSIAQNMTDDVKLDAMQTMTLIEEFKLQVEDYIVSQNAEGNSEPTVLPKELHEILNDLLEDVMVQQEDAPSDRCRENSRQLHRPGQQIPDRTTGSRGQVGIDRPSWPRSLNPCPQQYHWSSRRLTSFSMMMYSEFWTMEQTVRFASVSGVRMQRPSCRNWGSSFPGSAKTVCHSRDLADQRRPWEIRGWFSV